MVSCLGRCMPAMLLGVAIIFHSRLRATHAALSEKPNQSESAKIAEAAPTGDSRTKSVRFDSDKPNIDARLGLITSSVPLPSSEHGGLGGRRIIRFHFDPILPPYDSVIDDRLLVPPKKTQPQNENIVPDRTEFIEEEVMSDSTEPKEEIKESTEAVGISGSDNETLSPNTTEKDYADVDVDTFEGGEIIDSDRNEIEDSSSPTDESLEASSREEGKEKGQSENKFHSQDAVSGKESNTTEGDVGDNEDTNSLHESELEIQNVEDDGLEQETYPLAATDSVSAGPGLTVDVASSDGKAVGEEVVRLEVEDTEGDDLATEAIFSATTDTAEAGSKVEIYGNGVAIEEEAEHSEVGKPEDDTLITNVPSPVVIDTAELAATEEDFSNSDGKAFDEEAEVLEVGDTEDDIMVHETQSLTLLDTPAPDVTAEDVASGAEVTVDEDPERFQEENAEDVSLVFDSPSLDVPDVPDEGVATKTEEEHFDKPAVVAETEAMKVDKINENSVDTEDTVYASQVNGSPVTLQTSEALKCFDDVVEYAADIHDGKTGWGSFPVPANHEVDGSSGESIDPDHVSFSSSYVDYVGEESDVMKPLHETKMDAVDDREKIMNQPHDTSTFSEIPSTETDAGYVGALAAKNLRDDSYVARVVSDSSKLEAPNGTPVVRDDTTVSSESTEIEPDIKGEDFLEVKTEQDKPVQGREEASIAEAGLVQGREEASNAEAEQTQEGPHVGSAPSSSRVNAEFIDGLDDLHKFIEEVDPPDELDVGAIGTSMQEVLMGKSIQILGKRISRGLGHARKVSTKLGGRLKERVGYLKEKAGETRLAMKLKEGMESLALIEFRGWLKERLELPRDVSAMFSKQKEKLMRFGNTARMFIDRKIDQFRDLIGHDVIDKCRGFISNIKDFIGLEDENEEEEEYMKFDVLKGRVENLAQRSGIIDDDQLGGADMGLGGDAPPATSLKDRLAAIREQGKKNAENAIHASGGGRVSADQLNAKPETELIKDSI